MRLYEVYDLETDDFIKRDSAYGIMTWLGYKTPTAIYLGTNLRKKYYAIPCETHKRCPRCNRDLPIDKVLDNGWCRSCHNEYIKEKKYWKK